MSKKKIFQNQNHPDTDDTEMIGNVFLIPLLLLATVFWNSFKAHAFLPHSIVSCRSPRRLLSTSTCSTRSDGHLSNFHSLGNWIVKQKGLQMSSGDEQENEDLGPQSCNVLGTTLSCCCDNVRQSGIGTGK